jgi:transposase-like protein
MPDIKTITRRKAGRVPVLDRPDADFDIDLICDMISTGESLTAVANEIGIHTANLIRWIENDSQRSARAREARVRSARIWDEKAERVIAEAPDKFELDRAQALAHHYRWRAKAIAPRDYGDKVQQEHTGAGGGPIAIAAVDLRNLTDAELENMNLLMSKASGST